MRSIKLLVAMAAIAALVAGPVLAQETAPAPTATSTDAAPASGKGTTTKKHTGKKHKKHAKKSTSSTAPATTPAQ